MTLQIPRMPQRVRHDLGLRFQLPVQRMITLFEAVQAFADQALARPDGPRRYL